VNLMKASQYVTTDQAGIWIGYLSNTNLELYSNLLGVR
jgi:hypothetical protein